MLPDEGYLFAGMCRADQTFERSSTSCDDRHPDSFVAQVLIQHPIANQASLQLLSSSCREHGAYDVMYYSRGSYTTSRRNSWAGDDPSRVDPTTGSELYQRVRLERRSEGYSLRPTAGADTKYETRPCRHRHTRSNIECFCRRSDVIIQLDSYNPPHILSLMSSRFCSLSIFHPSLRRDPFLQFCASEQWLAFREIPGLMILTLHRSHSGSTRRRRRISPELSSA